MKLRNLLTFISSSIFFTFASFSYDFEVNGIFYNILSQEELTVEVTTGNTERIPPQPGTDTRIPTSTSDFPNVNDETKPCDWIGNSYKGNVKIPQKVTYNGNVYNVVSIGEGAFVHCTELNSVDVPPTVLSIGRYAFSDCYILKDISLPDNIATIDNFCFSGCLTLQYLRLPSASKAIPRGCFVHTGSHTDCFEIGNYHHIEYIGDSAFGSSSIKYFDFDSTSINSADNIGTNIFNSSKIEELILPSRVSGGDYGKLLTELLTNFVDGLKVLTINCETPPAVDPETTEIPKRILSGVTLKVPETSLQLYKSDPFWKQFLNTADTRIINSIGDNDSNLVEYYHIDGSKASPDNLPSIYIVRKGESVSIHFKSRP